MRDIDYVWHVIDLPDTQRIILGLLAAHKPCNPSLATLARKGKRSRATVIRTLASLEADGIIEAVAYPKGGGRNPTEWCLHLDRAPRLPTDQGCHHAATPDRLIRLPQGSQNGATPKTESGVAGGLPLIAATKRSKSGSGVAQLCDPIYVALSSAATTTTRDRHLPMSVSLTVGAPARASA